MVGAEGWTGVRTCLCSLSLYRSSVVEIAWEA
jgi:hypothetical protein